MNPNSYQSQPIRALSLLSAITRGQATVDDLAAELRRHGLPFSYSKFGLKLHQKWFHAMFKEFPRYHLF